MRKEYKIKVHCVDVKFSSSLENVFKKLIKFC